MVWLFLGLPPVKTSEKSALVISTCMICADIATLNTLDRHWTLMGLVVYNAGRGHNFSLQKFLTGLAGMVYFPSIFVTRQSIMSCKTSWSLVMSRDTRPIAPSVWQLSDLCLPRVRPESTMQVSWSSYTWWTLSIHSWLDRHSVGLVV